jgi:NAD(P)-dependent dehydrogenase (short-subunit alcohol dehydrogenase family)
VSQRFDGRVAVITGGASGIGRGIAYRFAAEGAEVIIADLNEAAGAETAEAAAAAGLPSVSFVPADVADERSVEAVVGEAVRRFGRLDCMVNNAGIGGAFGSVMETSVDHWDATYAVLVRGVFLGIKHGARAMVAKGIEGSIINVASLAAFSGGNGPIAYSSAKAAVVNMTQAAAVELAAHRIRVNAICPGAIKTPMLERGLPAHPDDVLKSLQPWPVVGSVEDVAGAAAYLASDDARFVTGTALVVDGGMHAGGPRVAAHLNAWRASAGDPEAGVGMDYGSTGVEPVVRRRS